MHLLPEFHLNNKKIILTPPIISADHIKQKVSCIRAHRERLFQVSTTVQNGTLVCHNYGQGGAGWTFLFGCVHESIRQFEQQLAAYPEYKKKPIAVIGAGCYGLLTAIILARKGYQVRIVAKETEHTPSEKAAGFFFPRPRKSATEYERAIFYKAGIESYETYLRIARGQHPFIAGGPVILPAYFGLDNDPGFGPYVARGLIDQPQKVTIDFGFGKYYEVMQYHILFINPRIIMQELQCTIKKLGITIIRKEVAHVAELDAPIVFNCAGFGAKQLAADKRIIPVQGHLITLQKQPIAQLQYMINVKVTQQKDGRPRGELIYFAPKDEGILGITFKRGQTDIHANYHEFDRLLERCHKFFGG